MRFLRRGISVARRTRVCGSSLKAELSTGRTHLPTAIIDRDTIARMFQSFLLGDTALHAPPTEGIKYAGSKLKLLPYILQLAKKVSPQTVFDGFSGTTR